MLNKKVLAVVIASSLGLAACGSDNNDDNTTAVQVDLRILETSDLHTNIMDYDYYKSKYDPTIGLARTASLIKQKGSDVSNFVLVDNGDLLQGSPMGDYVANNFKRDNTIGGTHPAYKAMNTLGYSVGNIGNHEFNYGLDFLSEAIAGANFPYINANVLCEADCWEGKEKGDNLFTPYLIEEKVVIDSNGDQQIVKIGYIGFVPPQILLWDKQNLSGKVSVMGIVEAAEKFVPMMKEQGADVIVAIPHSGVGSPTNPVDVNDENATYALSLVDGIDAITFGHSHSVFPSATFDGLANADLDKGTINGVAAVMPGRWGDNLGVVDIKLEMKDGKWMVIDRSAKAEPIYDKSAEQPELVQADNGIRDAVAMDHANTLAYVDQPIGKASADMYSFLTLVQDDPSVQIVSNAQIEKVKQNLTDALKDIPVLSASAPFKAGGRHSTAADADSYVQVPAGDLTYKNAADLYLYPNTMVAVKVTGAQVKDWLECSANQFNQIAPNSTEPQYLINWDTHRTYNFDVIDGVTYKIDVTQPTKFDGNCKVVNADANRIVGLSFQEEDGTIITGEALATKEFIIASNNYRAFGGKFAGTGSDYVVMELPDSNREALAEYITVETEANGEVNPAADNNWDFVTINTATKLDVRFETQDSELADKFIAEQQLRKLTKRSDLTDEFGFAIYNIDLTTEPAAK
ncbi:2',3'-cyclic-nucleotide 2'-phosphodiesterase [Shewanella colwelliana]|uniref:2',3'-cyclic-nucleotide 2'-phosphodiesterase n=1 Tax=Shewanella colwelliana TaxID=23 RepID=A0A1E5INU8_SHECO|nr:bifunctional 2',3'-cyclic-nucleotide 2'-phosphodiesterase/3'-nucleotidase [Shewanella colwelliana]OEG72212.1 2',3'-cyclic-nucleotide 2'-phosphodiesterase [Shewanella colwelliana]GIU27963.1 2',3'-cyclic-nucleotide 2'-phosphodiesterase [Shewanella colwelliana]GIU34880.1 2',3'-cyclic-nucleotide 2'-phosphodiesterase [Shewanella colwelliana]